MSNGRTVAKHLIGQEDIYYGETPVNQTRGGGVYAINGVRNIQPVNSIAERDALDTTKFTKCRLYDGSSAPVDYAYVSSAWVALPNAAVLSIKTVTSTTYTLLSSDLGKVLLMDNALPITITVPAGLSEGFHCQVVQEGAGQVSFLESSTTIHSAGNELNTRLQYSAVAVQAKATDVFLLAGDLSA
jgi:hypothetical protein